MKKQTIFNNFSIVTISLLLVSCFVAKDYKRPDFEDTKNLYRTDLLPADSLSMANISWRKLFADPYLTQYIEAGLKNNIDIRVALQQILATEAYLKQGKAGYLPSISVNTSVTHQELSKNSQFGSFLTNTSLQQYDLSTNMSWEADIWGKIRSNKRTLNAAYLKSVAAHQAIKTRLISNIAATYYQLLALDKQLQVTKETITTRENSVETITALKVAGQVTQVAVDQNIAQLNNAQALRIDLEVAIFKTENALSLLLGEAPKHWDRSTLNKQSIHTEIILGVPSILLQNRPDVMASEYALIEAFELTNVARSNFYPSLTISATGGFQSLELDKWISVNSLFTTIIGGLTQPIFNNRAIKTQYEVAQIQQEQALLNFKQTLLIAGNEVSNALFNYKAETEKAQFRQQEVAALRRAESNSEELLNYGFATYLDLLTARQSALNAELNSIDTKLQQLLSIINLYQALGGGWM